MVHFHGFRPARLRLERPGGLEAGLQRVERLPLAAALLSFLTTPAQAEPIILCGGDTVFVVDTATAKDNIEHAWSWKAIQCEQLPTAMRGTFATTDDCKPVDGGSKILISSSSGGCAVVERPSGKVIWYAQVPNAHSLELLPRGRIVVASSVHAKGNRLVLFDLAQAQEMNNDLDNALGHYAALRDIPGFVIIGYLGDIPAVRLFQDRMTMLLPDSPRRGFTNPSNRRTGLFKKKCSVENLH